jgi:hypothetical protein
MKPRPRVFVQFRLSTLFVAVTLAGVLTFLNTLPGPPKLLGHVSSDEPPIAPGMFVMGNDYGWPWTYRTESFKTETIQIRVFDHLSWGPLAANIAVGLLAVIVFAIGTNLLLRLVQARERRET